MASEASVDSGGKKPLFTPQEIDQIAKFLVLNQRRERENMIIPRSFTPTVIKSKEEKLVEATFESCPFKSVLSLVAGEWQGEGDGRECVGLVKMYKGHVGISYFLFFFFKERRQLKSREKKKEKKKTSTHYSFLRVKGSGQKINFGRRGVLIPSFF